MRAVQDLAFSQACENNKAYILAKLRKLWAEPLCETITVLEIGSGTGQHAVHFAQHLPVEWQCADLPVRLPPLQQRLDHAGCGNLKPAIPLDVDGMWPNQTFDAVYTANTLHIMSWAHVRRLFEHLASILTSNGCFIAYGPFNYDGQFTSTSNAEFNQWLLERDPLSGIRDMEAVNQLAEAAGLQLLHDFEMPANNRLLVWQVGRR